jgi:hypothetical protein
MKKFPLTLRMALLSLLTTGALRAQITSLNPDSHTIVGARAAALADAVTSQAFDATTIYWNPAGLSYMTWSSIPVTAGIETMTANNHAMTYNVVVPLPRVKDWAFAVGGTMHQFHQSGNASPLRGLSFSQNDVAGAVSYRMMRALSLGATVEARISQSATRSLWSMSGSFGLLYVPQPGVSYGLSVQGLGSSVAYPYENPNDLNDIHIESMIRSLQMGLSISFPTERPEQPVVVLCLANQKILGQSGVVYKLGIEYWPLPIFAARMGYWVGPTSVAMKLGAALRFSKIQVDYAISSANLEPKFQQITLSYLIAQR